MGYAISVSTEEGLRAWINFLGWADTDRRGRMVWETRDDALAFVLRRDIPNSRFVKIVFRGKGLV